MYLISSLIEGIQKIDVKNSDKGTPNTHLLSLLFGLSALETSTRVEQRDSQSDCGNQTNIAIFTLFISSTACLFSLKKMDREIAPIVIRI